MNAKKAKKLRKHLRQMLSQEVQSAETNHLTKGDSDTIIVNPATFRGCYNIVKKAYANQ